MARVTVIHVVSSMNLGGAERFTLDLSQTQRSNGVNPIILNLGNKNDQLMGLADELSIKTETCEKGANRVGRLWHAWGVIKREKPDAIQIHSPFALFFLYPLFPFVDKKTKMLYTRHGNAPLTETKWIWFHKIIFPFVDWITFVSEEGQRVYHKNHKWPYSKSKVIENGVHVPTEDEVLKTESDTGKIRFGSVGRIDEIKGQIHLLKALELMPENYREKIEVHFFGSGPLEEELRSYAKNNIQLTNVIFHGFESARDRIYSCFDVLLVCSRSEGLSLAIMEAMVNKIPVIATEVGGNPRLVNHEVNGLLVPYADPNTLLKGLTMVCDKESLINVWGVNARDFIIQNFSLKRAHEQYYECYKQ